jgi:hypothetical protein
MSYAQDPISLTDASSVLPVKAPMVEKIERMLADVREQPTYSFNTSALIDWWVRHSQPDIQLSLKINVEPVIAEGRFKASRYVLTEVEQGGDELQGSAKRHKDQTFIEEDEAAQKIACSLIKKYSLPDNPKKRRSGADPFVIARSQLGNPVVWTVVSGVKPTDADNPKIPYVSGQLDVLTFPAILGRRGGWPF